VAPYDECLRDEGPPDRMLAKLWRRLFLAAFGLNLVVDACCPGIYGAGTQHPEIN